jgi:hypothetical protein
MRRRVLVAFVLFLGLAQAQQGCSQLSKSSATITNSLAYVNVTWSFTTGLTWQLTSPGVFATAPSNFGDVKVRTRTSVKITTLTPHLIFIIFFNIKFAEQLYFD